MSCIHGGTKISLKTKLTDHLSYNETFQKRGSALSEYFFITVATIIIIIIIIIIVSFKSV